MACPYYIYVLNTVCKVHIPDYLLQVSLFATIEYTRVALGCTLPPEWLVPTGVYLIKFLIGNLSYSPSSEPSSTVGWIDFKTRT